MLALARAPDGFVVTYRLVTSATRHAYAETSATSATYEAVENAEDIATRRPVITHFGGGSGPSKALDRGLRLTVKPVIRAWRRAPHLPWPYTVVDHVGRALVRVPGVVREPLLLPHCSGELVRPTGIRSGRVVVYLHGGAFLVGGQHLHGQLTTQLAHDLAATLVVPNYRKLPTHPVALAIEDALDAYRLALELADKPSDVVIMGDSAGGYLTFMLAIAAQRAGLPLPAGLVALSPLVEFEHPGRWHDRRAARREVGCSVFPGGSLGTLTRVAARAHYRSEAHRHSPLESPAQCELAGLPPTLIQISSTESLYPQARRMAQVLAQDGVDCELQVWDGQAHVFQAAHRIIPEAAQAVACIEEFLQRVVPIRPSSCDASA